MPRKRSQHQLQIYNPFRKPTWRYDRALSIVERYPPGRCTHKDDQYVRKLRALMTQWRRLSPEERPSLYNQETAGLYSAFALWERRTEDQTIPFVIEARLLARQSYEEIAKSLNIFNATVAWYANCFFDVAPYLNSRDWVFSNILIPCFLKHNQAEHNKGRPRGDDKYHTLPISAPFMDWSCKFFAYFGGPRVLDHVLTGYHDGKGITDEAGVTAYYDQHVSSQLKRRAAQAAGAFEINQWTVMPLFELHNQINVLAKSAANEQEKTTKIEAGLGQFLSEIPWGSGAHGRASVTGTGIEIYDDSPGELRSDETLAVMVGETPPAALEVLTTRLALPARTDPVRETPSGSASD